MGGVYFMFFNTNKIRTTVKRFRRAISNLVRSEQGGRAVLLFVLLVVMMLGLNGLNVLNSYVGRDFMSAIEQKDGHMFWRCALIYLSVLGCSTLAAAYFRFTEEHLGLVWRRQLTARMANAYLSERAFQKLEVGVSFPNPDQRISEDVRAFTTTSLSFTLLLMNGFMTAISFSGVLWSISPKLFGVAVVYATVGTVVAVLLGRPLMKYNYDQLDREADFRADLIHVREHADAIALSHREGRFRSRIDAHLESLVGNYRRIIRTNRNLGFFTNGYNNLIQLLPALIIAPLYIDGKIEFGVITQSAMAFAALLGAFSLIVTQFHSISSFTAISSRLQDLSDALYVAREEYPCEIAREEGGHCVVYESLNLVSKDAGEVLVADLSLRIEAGSRWIVTCSEDGPKSSLFRATAGFWQWGSGRVLAPGPEEILFLTERPYLPPGTLRGILLRSGKEEKTSDEEIETTLEKLGLPDAVKRAGGLDSTNDWAGMFSIEEQHLLSIARILLSRPEFVCMDRPGSALSLSRLTVALDLFRECGIGAIVMAKREEITIPCDGRLELTGQSEWNVHRG